MDATFLIREEKREEKEKDGVAEAKSLTCSEQRLIETEVARRNLPDQSASLKQRTPDTGINDLPFSQQPPISHATPAQDTGVSRNSSLIGISWA